MSLIFSNVPAGVLSRIIVISGIVPAIGAMIAIYFNYRYPISEDDAYGIRAKLEERRGVS